MKKVSLVLLALLFSAGMASAESFSVKAENFGIDRNGAANHTWATTNTYTEPKEPGLGVNTVDQDIHDNIMSTSALGSNAVHFVTVHPECVDCDPKFYGTVTVDSVNAGTVAATTGTASNVGEIRNNVIDNGAIGANAFGSYKNDHEFQTSTNNGSAVDETFYVTAVNHGSDINGGLSTVEATTTTATIAGNVGKGTSEVIYEGGDVHENSIDNLAYGSNAGMAVEVNIDCECEGKFYTDVQVDSKNYGQVVAIVDTYSTVANVHNNSMFNTAIGANASGSYSNFSGIATP